MELQTLTLSIYLHNISKSYYYYRISLELYQNASGNPFAQPVQVFSNIENGFGVFAGSQINYFDLLKKFLTATFYICYTLIFNNFKY